MDTQYDIVAFGGCYLDINSAGLPFGEKGVPIEKELRASDYACLPGGSGMNFVRALTRAGRQAIFTGVRGDDAIGDVVERLCDAEQLPICLVKAQGYDTNIGINMVGEAGHHAICSLGNANQALNQAMLLPVLERYLPSAKFLYMGTLHKLDGLAPDFGTIVNYARKQQVKIVVDHGRLSPRVKTEKLAIVKKIVLDADYYLPSRLEFLETWSVSDIATGLKLLAQQAPHLTVIVKDGDRGAHYLEGDQVMTIRPPKIEHAQNATGAGDTFNAGFLNAVLGGKTLDDAISDACVLAADHVSTVL